MTLEGTDTMTPESAIREMMTRLDIPAEVTVLRVSQVDPLATDVPASGLRCDLYTTTDEWHARAADEQERLAALTDACQREIVDVLRPFEPFTRFVMRVCTR